MAQVKCKCGEPLTIEAGATVFSCPACNAIYRVRTAPSAPAAKPAPAPAPENESALSVEPPPVAPRSSVKTAAAPVRASSLPAKSPTASAKASPAGSGVQPAQPAKSVQAAKPASGAARVAPRPLAARGSVRAPVAPPVPIPAPSPSPSKIEAKVEPKVEMPVENEQAGEIEPAPEAPDFAADPEIAAWVDNVDAAEESPFNFADDSAAPLEPLETAIRPAAARSSVKSAAKASAPHRSGVVARSASRSRAVIGEPATPPSKAALLVAAAGVLMALGGIAVIVLASMDNTPLKRPGLVAARDELSQKIDATVKALAAERASQDNNRRRLVSLQKKLEELKYNEDMIDHRFAAANDTDAIKIKENLLADERTKVAVVETRKQMLGLEKQKKIERATKSVIDIRTDKGSGTGFVLTVDGIAVTNYHVVAGTNLLTVNIQQRDSKEPIELAGAHIIACNQDVDLALIQLPPAPPSVAEKTGDYPIVVIKEDPPVAGENVFAIGNPGVNGKIMTFSTSYGIVSNSGRSEGTGILRDIQTDAAVNHGNSGGPLFDEAGCVMGVISLKGINVESVSFARPIEYVQQLMKNRTDPEYAVTHLPDWEKEHNPALGLTFADKDWQAKAGIPLTEDCTHIELSPDGKILYLLFGQDGKIQEYLLAEKKFGRSYAAGFALDELLLIGNTGYLAAVSKTKNVMQAINMKTLTLEKSVTMRCQPNEVSCLGGTSNYIHITGQFGGESNEAFIVSGSDLIKGGAGAELPRNLQCFDSGSNGTWSVFETYHKENHSFTLHAIPQDACMSALGEWIDFRQKNPDMTKADVTRKTDSLAEKLTAAEASLELPSQHVGVEYGPILFVDSEHILVGRHAYKLGAKIEKGVEFEPNPSLRKGLSDAQDYLYTEGDTLQSITTDGKWAASRAHVYNVATGKIVKKIPFICEQPVFSRDGRTIYALDGSHHYVFRFTDWETSLESPK